jgi:hypothetical protein
MLRAEIGADQAACQSIRVVELAMRGADVVDPPVSKTGFSPRATE